MSMPALLNGVSFSSFGEEGTTMSAEQHFRSDRYRDLDFKQGFYECTQHDWKRYDFDGRVITPGSPSIQPLLTSDVVPYLVPIKFRRPSNPYRLARLIVNSFTNMIFGDGRFPRLTAIGGSGTQRFANALIKEQRLPMRMIQARGLGGSVGSVGLAWCFVNGKPRLSVRNTKYCIVHEWEDREEMIPAYVTEIYKSYEDIYNRATEKVERHWFWNRRDWTTNADIVYYPCPDDGSGEPVFVVNGYETHKHNDGICHFVWIQNTPSDEIDGQCDYEGLYEQLDNLDILYSVLTRGSIANLDPTLVFKVNREEYNLHGVKKGSDNALVLDKDESVDYLELTGQSIGVGLNLFESNRRSILEICQCVLADPDKVAAQGTSSLTMRIVYAPMTSRCDIFRTQYGDAILRLIDAQMRVAQYYSRMGHRFTMKVPSDRQENGEDNATDNVEVGDYAGSDLIWGQYFKPTQDDQAKAVQTASQATGGKQIMSTESAIGMVASAFGHDPAEEIRRVATEVKLQAEEDMARQEAAFSPLNNSVGGVVSDINEEPELLKPV